MNWLFFAFIPPIANALVNYIDKYLITRYIKGRGIGSLVIFSALMGLPTAFLIALFKPAVLNLDPIIAIVMIINGSLFMGAVIPYLYALEQDETSIVSPLSQMATIISFILGYIFLKESLSFFHLLAFIFIITGAVLLATDIKPQQKIKVKKSILWLMLLASLLLAVNGLIFKLVAQNLDFWTTSFWEYMGFVVFAVLIYMAVKPYRLEFVRVLQTNSKQVLSINVINEVLAISGKTSLHFATLLTSLSLVFLIAEGFQPFFVLIFGVLITVWFPKITQENLSWRILLQKLGAIIFLFLGTFFVQLG